MSGLAESRGLRSNSQTLDGVFRPLEPNTLRTAVWDLSSSVLGEHLDSNPRKLEFSSGKVGSPQRGNHPMVTEGLALGFTVRVII